MAIYFTSGTSGSPKMTGHTHSSFGLGLSINGRYSPTTNGSLRGQHCPGDIHSLLFQICVPTDRDRGCSVFPRFWLDLTPSDVMWNTSDTGWAKSAWSSVFSPWAQGACVFAHHLPRFEPTTILQVRQSTRGPCLEMHQQCS